MYAALRYAENDDKTDKKMFVGGINCSKQNAYAEMVAVQRRFGMKGKVVAYHGIQSFKPGEITPEQAFEIGKETAMKMWGDKYQVLVTVHLNTQSTHCHFVVNPCSFVDGQKFKNKIGDHLELRKVSDTVCREHGLSVLENSNFYSKGKKKEYWAHRNRQMTHRDMIKADIEEILPYCGGADDIYAHLEAIGYTLNDDHKHLTIIAPGWQRPIRLDTLGFTRDYLNSWIDDNNLYEGFYYYRQHHPPYKPRRFPLDDMVKRMEFTVEYSHNTATVLVDLLFLIIIEVFRFLDERTDIMLLSPELRHELRNFKKFVSEYHFLESENIHTMKGLEGYIAKAESDIAELEHQRQLIDNKRRRASPDKKQRYKDERKEITEHITPLRKRLRKAKDIYEKSPRLYELVKLELDLEKQARENTKTKSKDNYERQ